MPYQTANLLKHLSYKVNILEVLIKHVLLCRNLHRTTVYSLPEFPHLKNAPNIEYSEKDSNLQPAP